MSTGKVADKKPQRGWMVHWLFELLLKSKTLQKRSHAVSFSHQLTL